MIQKAPRLLAALCLFLIAARASAQHPAAPAPPGDPFLADEDDILSLIPDDDVQAKQVTLMVDWIQLPHATANRLIREQLTSASDGGPLHAAVEKLIAGKQAARLDVTTLVARSGQRAKTESIVEHPHPTEYDPSMVMETIWPDGRKTGRIATPPLAQSIEFKHLGRMVEAEVVVSEDNALIDVNLAPEWIEHLGEMKWTEGISETRMQLYHSVKLTAQLLLTRDRWMLAALVAPPQRNVTPPEYAGFGPDRVMVFVRASLPGKIDTPAGGLLVPRQAAMIAEFIEVDTALLADLLDKQAAGGDSKAIRHALDAPLAAGTAMLAETAVVIVRNGARSKVASGIEFPAPEDERAGSGKTPPMIVSQQTPQFEERFLGTDMEAEVNIGEATGPAIDINFALEVKHLNGIDIWQPGPANVKRPRYQFSKYNGQVLLEPGEAVLATVLDAPLPRGQSLPAVRTRKLLVFVRAVL